MSDIVNRECNGCGLWENRENPPHNKIEVDLSNYVLISTGFKMKYPKTEIHFCNACYAKILDGEIIVANYGGTNALRKKNDLLESQLENLRREFIGYKNQIAVLLKDGGIK